MAKQGNKPAVAELKESAALSPDGSDENYLIAYRLSPKPPEIKPGERRRQWMDQTRARFSYRCLPLTMANQMGWDLLCPAAFSALWNGGIGTEAIQIEFHDEKLDCVESHFGEGVLTFRVGYLFRTPPGHNLWVKGPANFPKDGIQALEGLIETDWSQYTFTMNWLFTRPGHVVTFEKDDPICRIVPYPRDYLSEFKPRVDSLKEDPDVEQGFWKWEAGRRQFLEDLKVPESEARKEGWQKDYMRGQDVTGSIFDEHQTKPTVPDFVLPEAEPDGGADDESA